MPGNSGCCTRKSKQAAYRRAENSQRTLCSQQSRLNRLIYIALLIY